MGLIHHSIAISGLAVLWRVCGVIRRLRVVRVWHRPPSLTGMLRLLSELLSEEGATMASLSPPPATLPFTLERAGG